MTDKILKLNPAAFLFDLDGTLIDSETLWAKAIVAWLTSHGIRTNLHEICALVFGHSWLDIRSSLLARFPAMPKRDMEQDADELRAHYAKIATNPADMIIRSAVAFYREAAKIAPCAIVSGSPHNDVAEAARFCGIYKDTAFVLGAEDYAHGKPAPDGYLLAAKKLNVAPSDCIVVEDSTAGVKSGIAADMKVIGVDRNRIVHQDFSGCTLMVSDLSELSA